MRLYSTIYAKFGEITCQLTLKYLGTEIKMILLI